MSSWLRGSSAQEWNAHLRDAFSQAASSVQRLVPDEQQLQQLGATLKTGAQNLATQANAALEAAEDTLIGGISELAGVLDPATDSSLSAGLSGAKLQQLFEEEGHALASLSIVEVLTVLKGWAAHLEGPDGTRPAALQAFLRSHALEQALRSLASLKAGRAALLVAAGQEATKDGNSAAPVAAEVGEVLRTILACSSRVDVALRGKLLLFLADSADIAATDCGEQGKARANITDSAEVKLAMSLIQATATDTAEVASRSKGSRRESLDACLASVTEAKAKSCAARAPHDSAEPGAFAAGDAVWAEWPGDGHWFRARVEAVGEQEVEVQWLQAPPDMKCGQDDEYLAGVTGTSTERTALQKRSVRSGSTDRPAVAAIAEAEWPQAVEAADVLGKSFRELREVCEELSKAQPQGDISESPVIKALGQKQNALSTLKQEMESAAAAAAGEQGAQPCDEEEVKTVQTEREQLIKRAGEIEEERERLMVQLRTLDAESKSVKAAQLKCDQRLRALGVESAPCALSVEAKESLLEEVDGSLAVRLAGAQAESEQRGAVTVGRLPEVSAACLESEQLRRRCLEQLAASLHAAAWGPEADTIVRDSARLEALRGVTQAVSKIVEHAWREMVQMAAESFGDGGAVGGSSEDASRSAKRYKEMRVGLQSNLDRLARLEMNLQQAAPAAQAPVMGFVPPQRPATDQSAAPMGPLAPAMEAVDTAAQTAPVGTPVTGSPQGESGN